MDFLIKWLTMNSVERSDAVVAPDDYPFLLNLGATMSSASRHFDQKEQQAFACCSFCLIWLGGRNRCKVQNKYLGSNQYNALCTPSEARMFESRHFDQTRPIWTCKEFEKVGFFICKKGIIRMIKRMVPYFRYVFERCYWFRNVQKRLESQFPFIYKTVVF